MPASPILHGTALVPLIRYPRGSSMALRVVMDDTIDLDEHEATLIIRTVYGQSRPLFKATEAGEALTKEGQVLSLTLSPDTDDETEDSDLTFAALQIDGKNAYRIDFRDAEEALVLRLQGEIEWLPEEGAWDDDPVSTITLPEITVEITSGTIEVSVALITAGGSTIADIDGLQAALDAKASTSSVTTLASETSTALAAKANSSDVTTALSGKVATDDARLSDARTPTSHASTHAPDGSDPIEGVNMEDVEDTYDDGGSEWNTFGLTIRNIASNIFSSIFRIRIKESSGLRWPLLRVLATKKLQFFQSWSDETNYSRGTLEFVDGKLRLKLEHAGSGSAQALMFQLADDKYFELGAGGLTVNTGVFYVNSNVRFGELIEIAKRDSHPGVDYLSNGVYFYPILDGGSLKLFVKFPNGTEKEIANDT